MTNSFSPSVNIIRDSDRDFHYIPTNNSRSIYEQISTNFKSGVHSFNIIGSYGTGKSAFLLALSKHLNGQTEYFTPVNGQFNDCKKFYFINIVGQAGSFINTLAEQLDIEPDEKKIFAALKKLQKKFSTKKICLILMVDEFGKFLEYAVENNPDRELYFIQRIAEFANDAKKDILFLTTLHQNFDAYAIGLKESQRKEWEKVKGRLKELTFNEPIEQLLNLAAEHISQLDFKQKKKPNKSLLKTINKTRAFSLINKITDGFVEKLYPFDLLSAMSLTVALQRYGQNERSLFNFLQTEEQYGLSDFNNSGKPYFNLSAVYDYLQYNYYSTINSRYNPDFFKWFLLRNSLERIEVEFTKNIDEAQDILKTIGLLNILGSEAAKINSELIEVYAKHCLNISNAKELIQQLEEHKIIRYQAFKNRFKLFEGTDVNIDEVLTNARKETENINNLALELEEYFRLKYIPAKAVTLKKGTPRFFKFIMSDEPITDFNLVESEIDGIVNLLFEFDPIIEGIRNEPIIYGVFTNTQKIKECLIELKATAKAILMVEKDKVAKNELKEIQYNQIELLNDLLNDQLFGPNSSVNWYYEGGGFDFSTKRQFNSALSSIMEEVYHGTPTFRNELMNKTKVSSSIHYAKKQFATALANNWSKPDLGFEGTQVPPERTIYKTLLYQTGIHKNLTPLTADFDEPTDPSFDSLWKASINFLESAKISKRKLTEFIDLLQKKPFKIKDGFIEFWIITFLFAKRESFALFKDGRYLPRLNMEVMELFTKDAKKHEIKTFNIEGIKLDLFRKYRELTQLNKDEKVSATSFQETARPFLVFYKKLPLYAQKTNSLSHNALAFRKVIENAKELEKTFFEDLPTCFGQSLNELAKSEKELEQFVENINSAIAELRSAYDDLIDNTEKVLLKTLNLKKSISFKTYQRKINQRYQSVKKHLLFPRQKSLHSRLQSKLPDREAWLNSVVQVIIGKSLKNISDKEKQLLHDRFITSFQELDNLLELSQLNHNEETEEALKIEIIGFEQEAVKKNVILGKEQSKEVNKLENKISQLLNKAKNDNVKQAVLIKLLKDTL